MVCYHISLIFPLSSTIYSVLYAPRGRLHLLIGQHHDSWTLPEKFKDYLNTHQPS